MKKENEHCQIWVVFDLGNNTLSGKLLAEAKEILKRYPRVKEVGRVLVRLLSKPYVWPAVQPAYETLVSKRVCEAFENGIKKIKIS